MVLLSAAATTVLSILLVSSLCLLGILLYFLVWLPWRFHRFFQAQGIPGPAYRPLGEIFALADADKQGRMMDYFLEVAEEHGSPVFGRIHTLTFGPSSNLFIHEPEFVKAVLQTHKFDYHKSSQTMKASLSDLLGNGVLMSEGELWKKQRKLLATAFHHHALKDMTSLMLDACERCFARWRDKLRTSLSASSSSAGPLEEERRRSVVVEINSEISTLTLDIVATAAFGPQFLENPEVNEVVRHVFSVVLTDLHERGTSGMGWIPVLKDIPTRKRQRIKEGCRRLREVVKGVVNDRRAGRNQPAKGGKDLLGLLISAAYPETGGEPEMTEEIVVDEVITFVFAAYETTANMFTWLLCFIAEDREVWGRLQAEVEEVFGKDGHEKPLEFSDLRKLKFCEAVIFESIRLRPPAPMIGKYSIRDHTLTVKMEQKKKKQQRDGLRSKDATDAAAAGRAEEEAEEKVGQQEQRNGRGTQEQQQEQTETVERSIFIPKDTCVVVNAYVLHRHPKFWDEPLKFDPDRWLRTRTDPEGNIQKFPIHDFCFAGFSQGPRKCLGRPFALMESTIMLVRIIQNFQLRVEPNQRIVPTFAKLNCIPKYGVQMRLWDRWSDGEGDGEAEEVEEEGDITGQDNEAMDDTRKEGQEEDSGRKE